jgi:hypothetical protein
LPNNRKAIITDLIAMFVYWPLATFSRILEYFGFDVISIPLAYYRNYSFYTMRTDSRDRFGTPMEHRFTKTQIIEMMSCSGLVNIKFSEKSPYWCVIGYKA